MNFESQKTAASVKSEKVRKKHKLGFEDLIRTQSCQHLT